METLKLQLMILCPAIGIAILLGTVKCMSLGLVGFCEQNSWRPAAADWKIYDSVLSVNVLFQQLFVVPGRNVAVY